MQKYSQKSKSLCIILALVGNLLLIAGLHRFYAKKYITGTIMFFTLGGFLVWTAIDIVRLISNSFKDGNNQYIRKWFI